MKGTGARILRIAAATVIAFAAAGCANSTEYVRVEQIGGEDPRHDRDRTVLDVVTYNVAGLPEFVSRVGPKSKHPHIGPRLAAFDLVLLQEDFCYHRLLGAPHTWQAKPRSAPLPQLGDGLARFSWFPMGRVEHVPWAVAHGIFDHSNDRLAAKGFSLGTWQLAPDAEIFVYNLHCDAGRHAGDRNARARQLEQLLAHIEQRVPRDAAMIVAGDFNCYPSSFPALLEGARLADAFDELASGGEIDRVLYRSGSRVVLRAVTCGPVGGFEEGGERLSDHDPVRVRFEYEIVDGAAPTRSE